MKTEKSSFSQIIKRREILLFLILFISGLSLCGWMMGKIIFASVSLKYIPIAPSSAFIFFTLSSLLILKSNFGKTFSNQSITYFIVILAGLYCLLILLDYFFDFTWDIEDIFIVIPEKLGGIPMGRMSPITSILFISTCISILADQKHNSNTYKYIGGVFTLLTFFAASVLVIGYLYKAPLLYGSRMIPVALPTAICFLLFSITLLPEAELKFWTFNLIKKNETEFQLLKTFLPPIVFMVLLQGFIQTNFSSDYNNPTLISVIVMLIIVVLIVFITARLSTILGSKLTGAETKLRESEEFSRYLLQTIPFGMDIVDENGTLLFQSENLKNHFGDAVIGNKCWKIYRDDQTQCFDCPLRAGIEIGKTEIYESSGVLGGKIFQIIHTGMMFENKRAMLEIFIDITDRKKAEDELNKTNAYLENLINYANAPIIVWDTHFRIIRFNHAFESLTGRPEAEVLGQSLEILFPPDLAEKSMALIRKTLTGERWETVEIKILHRNGTVRTVLWNSATLFAPDGISPVATIAQGQDITRRKLAEEEIKLKNEELQKLNTEKDKFFSIIAHDLRSPLGSFMVLTQLIKEELLTMELVEIQQIAVQMAKSASNLFHLLENLLEWARIQRGLFHFNAESIQLHASAQESMELLDDSVKNKEIEIINDIPADVWVFADANMLQTIIRNLISNALKFTRKGGKVSLSAKVSGNASIEISVGDSGIGMSPEMVNNLFQLNIQNNRQGTEGESSSGLGLLLCKEFIEKLGGIIWVESEEGIGSVFHLTLPCSIENNEKIIQTPIYEADKQENQVNQKVPGLKVLIAEDDPDSEMLISLVLKPFSKDVLNVRNGFDAVEACRNNPDIDLVLMDIRMPQMDGYEATRQIRQLNTKVVIIAQTAFTMVGDREKAIEAGCTDYITKPIKKAELVGLVKKYWVESDQGKGGVLNLV